MNKEQKTSMHHTVRESFCCIFVFGEIARAVLLPTKRKRPAVVLSVIFVELFRPQSDVRGFHSKDDRNTRVFKWQKNAQSLKNTTQGMYVVEKKKRGRTKRKTLSTGVHQKRPLFPYGNTWEQRSQQKSTPISPHQQQQTHSKKKSGYLKCIFQESQSKNLSDGIILESETKTKKKQNKKKTKKQKQRDR